MKESITDGAYDTRMWPSDWRYSAAIVGLMRFFNDREIPYGKTEDYIEYNQKDIVGEAAEKEYLLFAENYFEDAMHHRLAEDLLHRKDLSDDQQKLLNEKLKANVISKKVFGKNKYPETSKETLLQLIEQNRLELIRETFRSGKSMYAKYANTNKLFSEADRVSRLNGYYIDLPKKGKSVAYRWDFNTYVASDEPEFDFIVFAFTKTREGLFINNNTNIQNLYNTNAELQRKIETDRESSQSSRSCLFRTISESALFIEYSVEVISKSQDKDVFETIYIRQKAINIFRDISDKMYDALARPCRLENGDYISCENIVTDSVLNNLYLDQLIELLLKEKNKKRLLIMILITVNQKIYGGEHMEPKTYYAKKTAELVAQKLIQKKARNKINSYQQKLISAICFKDYDKCCDILMNLSSYSEVAFDFAYDLFDDFEKNKNVAYAFAIALNDGSNESVSNKEGK